jgi:hypothetical protein
MGPLFKPFADEDGLASSIWAPKPVEQPDPRWFRAADRFTRPIVNDYEPDLRSHNLARQESRTASSHGVNSSFGPPSFPSPTLAALHRTQFGTIGEGRLRPSTPEVEDGVCFSYDFAPHHHAHAYMRLTQHVAQLLRTLDLNSPTPSYSQRIPLLSASFDATPDLSPSSQSSALLTPVDLSPARPGLDLKVNGDSLQFGPMLSHAPRTFAQNGAFIEPMTPERDRASSFLPVAQSPFFARSGEPHAQAFNGQQPPSSMFLPFDSFPTPGSPTVSTLTQLSSVGRPQVSPPQQSFDFGGGHHRLMSSWDSGKLQAQPLLNTLDWPRDDEGLANNHGGLNYRNLSPRMPLQSFSSPPQPHAREQSHGVSTICQSFYG